MSSAKGKELLIGRHIPFTKPDYFLGSIKKAVEFYNINCFMIYISSPKVYYQGGLDKLKIDDFKDYAAEKFFNIENIVVHSSYLTNLGDFSNQKKLYWSVNFLKDEFSKVEKIGLKNVVLHPGSSLQLDRNSSLVSVSKSLDEILECVPGVTVCLETMSGSGTQLGKDFDEIATIIKNSRFKSRIGVCLDTCHLYASGYDVKNRLDDVLEEFDQKIGLRKIMVVHVNDSVFPLGSKKDRHANIGVGQIGIEALSLVCHHPLLKKSIKILETPTKGTLHEGEIDQIRTYFTQI